MTIHHYIDNEVPWTSGCGEWSSRTQSGSSSMQRTMAAGWSERGQYGLRLTTGGAPAFVSKLLDLNLPGGGDCYVGCWLRLNQAGAGAVQVLDMAAPGGISLASLHLLGTRLRLAAGIDTGEQVEALSTPGVVYAGRWHYLVLQLHRASTINSSDGLAAAFLDGLPLLTRSGLDNYHAAAGLASLDVGAKSSYQAGYSLDVDEVKLADAYPAPFVPPCPDEWPSPIGLVVLYRQGSPDSLAFADYCVAAAGVPRANLIALPAGDQETLDSYAAFEAQVEGPIADYFARNPGVAENCCCFLVGYGLPGSFTSGGTRYSAVARLMRLGQPFQPGSANPLSNPIVVERLSVGQLHAHGIYLASRIDAASLAQATAMVDRALAVTALPALPASDVLLTDLAEYRQSLACQRLRIQSAGLAPAQPLVHDAAAWGAIHSVSLASPAGSRAIFCSTADGACQSLRNPGLCGSALLGGYAAAAGFAETAESLNHEAFFEMLRIGGCAAEAFAVASAHLDNGATLAGWPLMRLPFRRGGYNLYRSLGGIEQVNWQTPAAMLRTEQTRAALPLEAGAGTVTTYAIRAVSSRGIEEHNTHVACAVLAGEDGQARPLLPRPAALRAQRQGDGSIRLSFRLPDSVGLNWPDQADIFSDAGTGQINFAQPVAVVALDVRRRAGYSVTLPGTAGARLLAARCRLDAIVGQVAQVALAAATTPPAPAIL